MMTWTDLVSTVQRFADQCRAEGSVAWFRGHRDSAFELKSTLHRHVDRLLRDASVQPGESERRDLLRQLYKTLYRRFKTDAWPLLDPRERMDWGIIFAMQHYGLPTRLLDWTEDFACALYFALLHRAPGRDAAIWVLDPQALNQVALGRHDLVALDDDASPGTIDPHPYHPRFVTPQSPLRSIAVSPLFTNPRMTAQRSAFTVAGDSVLPLEQEFPTLGSAGHLAQLVIPDAACAEAAAFLAMAGLTAFSFYPDLQGIAMRHDAEIEEQIALARRRYPQMFKQG